MAKFLLVALVVVVALGFWHRKRRSRSEIASEGEWLKDELSGPPSD